MPCAGCRLCFAKLKHSAATGERFMTTGEHSRCVCGVKRFPVTALRSFRREKLSESGVPAGICPAKYDSAGNRKLSCRHRPLSRHPVFRRRFTTGSNGFCGKLISCGSPVPEPFRWYMVTAHSPHMASWMQWTIRHGKKMSQE